MILTEENVADYAHTLVLQVRAGGRELDYSEASIAIVEELLCVSDPLLQAPEMPENQRDLVIFYNGCYLGEVLSRNLGGAWRFDPETWTNASLVFSYREGGIQVHPFHKLYRRVTEGPEQNDLVSYYDGLKARLAATP